MMDLQSRWLRIKWAYQDGAMGVRFFEWCTWTVAWWLPRKLALIVFIRVYSATGDAPGPEYERVYKGWEAGAGR